MDQSSNTAQEKIDFFLLTAHELRTSLTAMKWVFKMLMDGDYGSLSPEQQSVIEQACQANDKMVGVLNNTMAAIKNDGVITYAKLPVHLPLFIAEIIKEFTSEATQKHIGLTYHQSPIALIITGDETKLRIAFHNIIENAIKYSAANTEISVSLSSDDQNAILKVQDQGIGVPAEQLPHLFEKFFRAGNTTEFGTGIGLYATKLMIEQQGGTIGMESQEHVGSTVTITLPLSR
jgi:two-component system phosphate regulon sensor histidine kinase PhoR